MRLRLDKTHPEFDLVLACARTHLDLPISERIKALVALGLDWATVIRLGSRHSVLPLLYQALANTCSGEVPPAIMSRLRQQFYANAGNSLILARELLDILKLFERHGLPIISYKGPVLALSLYGNIALRQFSDLDVLVDPRDLQRAKVLLVQHGWRPEYQFTHGQETACFRAKNEYFYRFDRSQPAGNVGLEVHWRLPATFALDTSRCWSRLQTVNLLGAAVPHLSPEDLLLILCVHGFKHFWNSLKWIADVAELLRVHPDIDWDRALSEAVRQGGARVLLLGCVLARDLLHAPLPARVAELADADPHVGSISLDVWRCLHSEARRPVGIVTNLRIRERSRDRAGYCLQLARYLTVPTMSDRVSVPLPVGLGFVHYAVRPFRVAGRMARKYRRPSPNHSPERAP